MNTSTPTKFIPKYHAFHDKGIKTELLNLPPF